MEPGSGIGAAGVESMAAAGWKTIIISNFGFEKKDSQRTMVFL
jgi:hypothetical protein